jgi:hypothetical protein
LSSPKTETHASPAAATHDDTRGAHALALAGFVLYAAAAPHSIAGAWIGLSLVVLSWLARAAHLSARARSQSLAARTASPTGGPSLARAFGLARTPLDVPLALLFAWTILSAVFSAEPQVSAGKLLSAGTFLIFYLSRAMLTRRAAVMVAFVLVASAAAGSLWSVGELALGRGVVVGELRADSPLRGATPLAAGDAVWRVNGRHVDSVAEIDDAIRSAPGGAPLKLSVVSRGEHAEWTGPAVTDESRTAASPSGIKGAGRTHRFRASGWTRHYGTHAEVLQMIAQLALGFALACLLRGGEEEEAGGPRRRRRRRQVALWFAAFALIGVGIAATAVRTALAAYVVGAVVLSLRAAARARARLLVASLVVVAVGLGAFAVWRTRDAGALALRDPSSALRMQVAEAAARRVILRPLFGHGMDAAKQHWSEWGFPGDIRLHTHSTPLQLAFERGCPHSSSGSG